jgi:hypothetical protein
VLERSPKSDHPTRREGPEAAVDFQCHEQFLCLASDRGDCRLHNGARARARRSGYENVDARRSINPGPVSVYLSRTREYRSYRSRVPTRESDESIGIPVCPLDHQRRFPPPPPPRLFLPVYSTLRIPSSLRSRIPALPRGPDHGGDFPTTFPRPDFL